MTRPRVSSLLPRSNAGKSKGAPVAAMGANVEFSQVSLVYPDAAGRQGQGTSACCDVTFSVAPGESVALIGPSGCGKSTTLLMAAGLLTPTEGRVTVGGFPLSGPRPETAFIPQDLGIFPWKTVLQNAALGLRLRKVPRREADQRAAQALEAVGLAGFERQFPRQLSGGMRQRLALARSLALEADLLLMDEPLSAVDALLRESLQEVLLTLWRERRCTQMLVTHSIEEAVYLGQRVLVFTSRPARVAAQVACPHAPDPAWRDSPGFIQACQEVRGALAAGTARNKGRTGESEGDLAAAMAGGRAACAFADASIVEEGGIHGA